VNVEAGARMKRTLSCLAALLVLTSAGLPALARAQPPEPVPEAEPVPAPAPEPKADPKWYDLLKLRGYTQFRYDNLPSFDVNPDLRNSQGDRYIGDEQGFGIRRARVILFGDVHPRVSVYLQTDFASVVDSTLHVPTVRDWYADIFVTPGKEVRFRVGQSKVPFGFENLQSSQNRLALDRGDPLNSALKDERDLGVFLYAAPKETRKLFKQLVDENLKGSGDYGVVALGIYNGQTANRPDNNGNFHVVGRLTYPFEVGSQVLEIGAAAYTGKYRVSTEDEDDGTVYTVADPDGDLVDRRAEVSFVWYPKPFGLQAEYNLGEGPSQGDPDDTVIDSRPLSGGYVQAMVKIDEPFDTVSLIPYVRAMTYDGGKKFETNAPRYHVREVEGGVEWQIAKALETTLVYAVSERTSPSYPYDLQQGHLFRAQVQVNY
jgi:hypothetical protein